MEAYIVSWNLIDNSTPKYNCHSFAWIQSSYQNNLIWLENPSSYMNSNDVSYIGNNVTPSVGDIIVLYDSSTNAINHSAVVISTPNGCFGIYVRSKIGGKALYDSPLAELSLYYHSNNYSVYR